ncbi:MAG: single-stranded DNA-binding protein [Flavobacteriales bacterium]|nr:single-stranded DNA-binding protein [Flavobacteriales bacterium]
MRNTINKVQLVGNLGNTPKVIELKNGKVVAKVDIAINEKYTNAKGEEIAKTQWHTLTAWGKLAKFVQKSLSKGQHVEITGKLNKRMYLDKMGIVRHITEVNCLEIKPQRA